MSQCIALAHRAPPCLPTPTAGIDSTRHNYLLLGLAIFQFPLNAWLARLPAWVWRVQAAGLGAAGLFMFASRI